MYVKIAHAGLREVHAKISFVSLIYIQSHQYTISQARSLRKANSIINHMESC